MHGTPMTAHALDTDAFVGEVDGVPQVIKAIHQVECRFHICPFQSMTFKPPTEAWLQLYNRQLHASRRRYRRQVV